MPYPMHRLPPSFARYLLAAVALTLPSAPHLSAQTAAAPPSRAEALRARIRFYENPLDLQSPAGPVESCPDPRIYRSQQAGDPYWYLFCTETPFTSDDRDATGALVRHYAPTFRSLDLIHWDYVGDVFKTLPAYAAPGAFLFAPKPYYANGRYYVYFTVTDTTFPGGGSAIGVATGPTLHGPWTAAPNPVVAPEPPPGATDGRRWNFDPEIVEGENGQKYMFFGSYFGGISARTLSPDGLSTGSVETPISIPNRYEAARVVKKFGYYYLFVSATNATNGPLTGYTVFSGRSRNALGPYVDKEGHSFLDGRVGGSPVLSMVGNRWVGPGHNDVFTDFAGHDWALYHAIPKDDPFFTNPDGSVDASLENHRPVLLDPLAWIDGWPEVRGGHWISDFEQFAPVAQPGQNNPYFAGGPLFTFLDEPVQRLFADEFDGNNLNPGWSWVRPPVAGSYGVAGGSFNFTTENADLYVDTNNASVLLRDLPAGDVVVETRVKVDIPPVGPGYGFAQAGFVFYRDDDNFVKLTSVAIFETRQTEFAKELFPVPAGYPRYGNTVVGTPGEWTYLRIVRRGLSPGERYTAYTSDDGLHWVHGGSWTHQLGPQAKLGLVAMGGGPYPAHFDYVRISRPFPLPPDYPVDFLP